MDGGLGAGERRDGALCHGQSRPVRHTSGGATLINPISVQQVDVALGHQSSRVLTLVEPPLLVGGMTAAAVSEPGTRE